MKTPKTKLSCRYAQALAKIRRLAKRVEEERRRKDDLIARLLALYTPLGGERYETRSLVMAARQEIGTKGQGCSR